ncbi:MAG: ABC transporter ATP-binding protein [Clostridia bacterium]|nr:ABC transporter ATP-binding protein [Clostridia bacterium]
MNEVLKCIELTKSYKPGQVVLDKLNFIVPPGKIFGLLGPNGCGKSTLLKLISGILVPDSGSIEICGIKRSAETNALISYLPERTYFNSWMHVDQLIEFFSEFYSDFDANVAKNMLSDLGVDTRSRLKTLSKGTKEKVQLILVMSRKASLYLLDEPIGGVDPAARDYILKTILGNYSPESSVIITTHLISDIEEILDEFAFMGFAGTILESGNAETVRNEKGKSINELFKEVFRCSENF